MRGRNYFITTTRLCLKKGVKAALDAHPDLYDELDGNRYSHACPFARIMEENLATRLVQVGLRTLTGHQHEQAQRFGVEQIDMKNITVAKGYLLMAQYTYP